MPVAGSIVTPVGRPVAGSAAGLSRSRGCGTGRVCRGWCRRRVGRGWRVACRVSPAPARATERGRTERGGGLLHPPVRSGHRPSRQGLHSTCLRHRRGASSSSSRGTDRRRAGAARRRPSSPRCPPPAGRRSRSGSGPCPHASGRWPYRPAPPSHGNGGHCRRARSRIPKPIACRCHGRMSCRPCAAGRRPGTPDWRGGGRAAARNARDPACRSR